MTDEKAPKGRYEAPRLTIVTFKIEQGFAKSLTGVYNLLGFYFDSGSDAWSGSASGGSQFGGGWVDNDASAWD